MKIILGNVSLNTLGGSETWTRTMYDELSKEHDVSVYSVKGYDAFKDMKVASPDEHYDLGLINHRTTFKFLEKWNIKRRVIVIHGVIPKEERPCAGADAYVAVSEEIAEKYKALNPVVIRNPIETDFYKPTRPISTKLKNVLFVSNYKSIAHTIIGDACRELGYNFDRAGGKRNHVTNMIDRIMWADMVIGLGRSAYEGMAAARNVIIFDYNGADGFATPEDLLEYRKNNCSGRRFKKVYTTELLIKEMQKYSVENGNRLREYIIENNNIETLANKFLKV